MAQVPYTTVSNVSSNLPATPSIHVDTPLAAFGGDVARAVSTLGQVTDQVGNEIYQRALALQQLHNESAATEADAKYQIGAGELHATFSQLQGSAAGPAAFNKYTDDLANLRTQIRGDLDNPTAQHMYDSSSLSTMGRTVFNGAGHSAEQMKQYAFASSKAQTEAANNQIMQNPTDPRTIAAGLATVEAGARFRGEAAGHDKDMIEQDVKVAKSDAIAGQIIGVSRSDPLAAKQLFDKAISDGTLRGETIPKVQETVDKQLYTTGAKNIASGIRSGTSMQLGQGPVDIERAKDAIANGIESGGNYQAVGPATKSGDHGLGKYQVMGANLPAWLVQAGLPVMSPKEFLADPAAQDKVFETIFGGYMKDGGSFNAAATKWFTGTFNPSADANDATSTTRGTTVPGYLAATNAQLAKTASLGDKVTAARAQAGKIAPDRPLLQDYTESQVITETHQEDAIKREDFQNTQNTINGAIVKAEQANTPISSIDDLKKDPEVAQAIAKLDPTQFLTLQKKIQTLAKSDDNPSDERTSTFQRLNGLAQTDPAKFLDIDPNTQNLTSIQRGVLVKMQKTLLTPGGKIDNPHVQVALSNPDVTAALTAAGITKKDDPDGYNKFAGALKDEIEQAMLGGKNVSYKDSEDIAMRLLRDHTSPGWLWNSTDKLFQAAPPADQVKIIKGLPIWKGREPNDDEVQRIYVRRLFNESLKADKAK